MSKGKKKSWPVIGSLRKSDDGTSYIKLADNVSVLVDGKPISLNDKKTIKLEDPRKKVEMLFDKGYIDEKTKDERLEKLAGMPWLRYDCVAVPPKSE